MVKQYFNKSNGEPKLYKDPSHATDDYTDIMPEQGLYRPVYFDNGKWIGTPYEEWKKTQPTEESNVNEREKTIEELKTKVQDLEKENESIKDELTKLNKKVEG